jgi:hypothetical protein
MDFCPIVGELVNPQTTSRESQQPKWICSYRILDIGATSMMDVITSSISR